MKNKIDYKKIKLIFYDCDGVLTDNKVYLDENGKEMVVFNRGDGFAISKINEIGIKQIVVSSEENPIVIRRCKKLRIECVNNIKNKEKFVFEFCTNNGIKLEETMFIGNDLNDLAAMYIVGVKGCPADAEKEILSIVDWKSNKNGGDGVIRELYRIIADNVVH